GLSWRRDARRTTTWSGETSSGGLASASRWPGRAGSLFFPPGAAKIVLHFRQWIGCPAATGRGGVSTAAHCVQTTREYSPFPGASGGGGGGSVTGAGAERTGTAPQRGQVTLAAAERSAMNLAPHWAQWIIGQSLKKNLKN